MKILFICLALVVSAYAQTVRQNYLISTRAGNANLGNGGPAALALLAYPGGTVAAADGAVYVSDTNHNQIRKITPSGTITVVAGTNTSGYSGDEGRANEAHLRGPTGLAIDSKGNLYFADTQNNRIRMIDPSGIIHAVAGNGTAGFSGDGGPANAASLNYPYGVAIDGTGRILIADTANNRIRLVDPTTQVIQTLAGGNAGNSGDGGPAAQALFNNPRNLTVDSAGNIYIADESNHKIRRISTSSTITTVAGTGASGYSGDGAQASAARLNYPFAVVVDSQQLYIADTYNMVIRRVDLGTGIISTFAGTGRQAFFGDNGPASAAQLNLPKAITATPDHHIVIADTYNFRIRAVVNGTISTLAGLGTFAGNTGPASSALLDYPGQVSLDANGNLLIADTDNHCIRRVDSSGAISTVAGICQAFGSPQEGATAIATTLEVPAGVVADKAGNIYIADTGNGKIRKVDSAGRLTTVAPAASFSNATFLALDSAQTNLYVSDSGVSGIAKINLASGAATVFAGGASAGYSGDGGRATKAQLNAPAGLAFDSQGNLYIADTGNNRVRRVDSSGIIHTYAGDGTTSEVEGAATSVGVSAPLGLAFDTAGNLLIAYQGFDLASVNASTGSLTYLVGGPGFYTTFTGDGGLAASANVPSPAGVCVDSAGNIYLGDRYSNRIRLLTPVNPVQLQVASGANQTGAPGAALPTFFAVQVTAANGVSLPGIQVQFAVQSGSATLSGTSVVTDYSGYASVAITLGSQPGPVVLQATVTGLAAVTVSETVSAPNPVPSINPGGIVPIYSTINAIQPGSWFSIYGANLAADSFVWNNDFPVSLGNTTVTVNGKRAYLWLVSPTQINAQAPDDTHRGPVTVTVKNPFGVVTSTVTLVDAGPSFSLLPDVKHAAGIIPTPDGSGAYGNGTYDLVGPSGAFGFNTRPVKAGETLVLFGTGFGATKPFIGAGEPYSGAASPANSIQVTIGGVVAPASFIGITEAGLFQFNLTVPSVPPGDQIVQASVGDVQTPPSLVTVQ